jgi:ribosomal-protein-alanine N-acetyltransferase
MLLSDLDAILEIERNSFEHPWSRPLFLAEFKKNIAHLRVLEDEAGLLCAYSVGWKVVDEFHLGNIAVAKAKRRQGYALKLLAEIEQLSGLSEVQLEVSHRNLAAIAFYQKNGFKQIAERSAYYQDGSNALILVKTLLAP